VVLIWVYYSAQIFLYGAELTKLYAYRFGSLRHAPPCPPGEGAAGDPPGRTAGP
jgi:membrane protein